MPNEGFLQRWSRLKAEPVVPELSEVAAAPTPVTPPPVQAAQTEAAQTEASQTAASKTELPLPTLADAAALGADSDYSAFVARGVDSAVRRLAMKKLFADPHFNVIDGLDIYMSDYNLPDPVSPAMLASLSHARSVFGRIEEALGLDAAEAPPAEPQALPPPDQEVA